MQQPLAILLGGGENFSLNELSLVMQVVLPAVPLREFIIPVPE
jgi:hypothetical protein